MRFFARALVAVGALLAISAFNGAKAANDDENEGRACTPSCPSYTAGMNLLLRDEMMYIFGGASWNGFGSELVYKYDTNCRCSGYTSVQANEFAGYPTSSSPAGLMYASSFFDNDKNYYLFGGMRSYFLFDNYYNDVWKLSQSTGVWSKVVDRTTTTCGSTQPSSGSYCQCDTRHSGECKNGEWANTVPMTRYGGATDVWGNGGSNGKGALILFGGMMVPYPLGTIGFDSVVYNDLWMLDLSTYQWTMLSPGDVSGSAMGNTFPQASGGGVGVVYNDEFYLYGGIAGTYLSPASNNYIWKWNLNGGSSWTRIGTPAAFEFRSFASIVRLDYDYNINNPQRTNGKATEVIIANGAAPGFFTSFRYTAYKWSLATNTFEIFATTNPTSGVPGIRWGAAAAIVDNNSTSSMVVYGGTSSGFPPTSNDRYSDSVAYYSPNPPYPAFLDLSTQEWTSDARSTWMGAGTLLKTLVLSIFASLACFGLV
mmetsp:Transcript_13316/g.34909  ORF Transcript_13316/g.34909 Transcript_13316/m.34909 type:complete len:482 (-) Transcript_13316:133-1578(-)